MSDFSKLKTTKNGKEYVLNACTQDTEQNITGTKNFTKLTVNSRNVVTSINGISPSENGNVQLGNIGAITGTYIQFAGDYAPDGFLVCNGAEVSRTTYSKLFAVIGTKYGAGDGSTTFNLPNLIGKFLEGGSSSGTVYKAGLPDIKGVVNNNMNNSSWSATGAFKDTKHSGSPYAGTSKSYVRNDVVLDFKASNYNSIYGNSTTVQPNAVTCLICIKY